MIYENLPSLKALNFFNLNIDCYKFLTKPKILNKKYLIKSFCLLLDEEEFAQVYMAWDEKGLYFIFNVNHPFTKASLELKKSDTIEIFIDTRSLKTKGYITKFCHHFIFFAQEVNGHKGMEITRFSGDDIHKLCDPKELIIESIIKPKSYMLNIEIPSICLVGFNPLEIDYLSFTYRINRFDDASQHFSLSSLEHSIEKSPHLWAKIILKN
jgi:hypothetical protein